MAIKVTTRSTASTQEAPLEAFGYNRNRVDTAYQAASQALGNVGQNLNKLAQHQVQKNAELARLKAKADAEVAKRQEAADKVVVDTGYHNYSDRLKQAEANHLITLQGGTVRDTDGNELDTSAALQELNPTQAGFSFAGQDDLFNPNMYFLEGKTADATTAYRDSLRRLDLEKADIRIRKQIDALDINARTLLANAKNKYAGKVFDAETYQSLVSAVIAFGDTDLKSRISERGQSVVNTRAQALMEEIHTWQMGNATTEQDIDNINAAYNQAVSQYTFLNPAKQTVANKKKNSKEDLYKGRFSNLQTQAKNSLQQNTSLVRGVLNTSPTDVVRLQDTFDSVQVLKELVDVHNTPDFKKRDLSLLNDSQLQSAEEAIAFGTFMYEIDEVTKLPRATKDILDEVKNLTLVKDYVLSETVAEDLPQTGDNKNAYVSWRKNKAKFISEGLAEGNLNVLNVITSNPERQETIYTALGYLPEDFINIPVGEFNINDVESSATFISAKVANNQRGSVFSNGYSIMRAPNASKEDILEGFVTSLAAIDSETTQDSIFRLTETVINLEQRSSKYGSIPKGIRDRIEDLEVLTMLDDLSEQAFSDENNSELSNMWGRIKQGLIVQAYDLMQKDLGGLEERYEEAKQKAKNKGEKVAEFNMPEFDSYLRKELRSTMNTELFTKIGFVSKSSEFNTDVYIHPKLYRTAVNTDVMNMAPGMWKNIVTSDFIQGIEQGWANMFSNEPYKALLPDVTDRMFEVNIRHIVNDDVNKLKEYLTPTLIQIAASAPELKGLPKTSIFRNNTKEQAQAWVDKFDDLDDEDLMEYLSEATIATAGGLEIPAFRFSKVSSYGGVDGVLWEVARPNGDYEPVALPVEGKANIPYIIPFSSQEEIITEEGLLISREPVDIDIVVPGMGPGLTRQPIQRKSDFRVDVLGELY